MQMRIPAPLPIEPGQESVWAYPRPPRLERVAERLHIIFDGEIIADTASGLRVVETSNPPTYYLPPQCVRPGSLVSGGRGSYCEWKGGAVYFNVIGANRVAERAAWTHPDPTPSFADLADHIAFYAAPMDACYVGDEQVTPQPGGFYGGWVTPRIVGPFKGEPGTEGW